MNIVLELLNNNANLILVLITTVYVVLTGFMAREMKRSREAENEAQLIATFIPFGAMHIKLRIQNAGKGAAFSVKANMKLQSENSIEETNWNHPVLLPNDYADFRLLGGSSEIKVISAQQATYLIDIEWFGLTNNKHKKVFFYDMRKLDEGWTKAQYLLRVQEIPVQLERIKDELTKIHSVIKSVDNRMFMKEAENSMVDMEDDELNG
jgi:hypothetical protein